MQIGWIFLCLTVCFMALILLSGHTVLILEWEMLEIFTSSFSLCVVMDIFSMALLATVSIIFTSVYFFTLAYLEEEVYLWRFLWILSFFVASMFFLVLGGNLFTSLIGWDGLGITSTFLIMFYSSFSAMKASILTFSINRLGDCFFILSIVNLSTISLMSDVCWSMSSTVSFMVVVLCITKSAQVPFSSWLPEAMEAPTPVSALVHSSTLVTAGIYLLLRYETLWSSPSLLSTLFFLSTVTFFLASMAGVVENDLKKIIALSTLSQLGFIMCSVSLGLGVQGFFHLIAHAYFKALMFMAAGHIIHHSSSWQDIRLISLSPSSSPVVTKLFLGASWALCGLPFMAGFFSKDAILDNFYSSNYSEVTLIMLLCSMLGTMFYTARLTWFLNISPSASLPIQTHLTLLEKSMVCLFLMACVVGASYKWSYEDLNPSVFLDSEKYPLVISLLVSAYFSSHMSSLMEGDYASSKWHLASFTTLLSSFSFRKSSSLVWMADLAGKFGWALQLIANTLKIQATSSMEGMKVLAFSKYYLVYFSVLSLVTLCIMV
uniref:NADH dehydrogenase subunit 5 n=1 Tax=Austromenopon paululum TaxID=2965261 RepID=UPI0026E432E2|nr:NADH dehydrogenase subunit 5 [Austromenopon paululum]WJJ69870.1 NADH dehydrogenase subunit 5 [Austromenopon paululum]